MCTVAGYLPLAASAMMTMHRIRRMLTNRNRDISESEVKLHYFCFILCIHCFERVAQLANILLCKWEYE